MNKDVQLSVACYLCRRLEDVEINPKDVFNMFTVCAGSGHCSHCVHVCEIWCLTRIQAFLASLACFKRDMAEIQPLCLSFWLFSVLLVVTAITRCRAKACWDRTEGIWLMWDALLWLVSKPWTVGCPDGGVSQCFFHWLAVCCCVSSKVAAKLHGLPASHSAWLLRWRCLFSLHFLCSGAAVVLLSLT